MSKKDAQQFDYEETVKKIRKLQSQNINKIEALARAGKAVDPAALANIKIDVFVDMFLDQNAKAAFALALETAFQKALDEGLSQVRQQQLTEGSPAQKLFIPR